MKVTEEISHDNIFIMPELWVRFASIIIMGCNPDFTPKQALAKAQALIIELDRK